MSLPCNFHDEADCKAGVLVGTAESVNHIKGLVAEFLVGNSLERIPSLGCDGLVVVLVFVRCPPDGVLRNRVLNKELVLGRTACVDTCHHVNRAKLGVLAFFVAGEFGVGFVDVEFVPRGVVVNLGSALDTILGQINVAHFVLYKI